MSACLAVILKVANRRKGNIVHNIVNNIVHNSADLSHAINVEMAKVKTEGI